MTMDYGHLSVSGAKYLAGQIAPSLFAKFASTEWNIILLGGTIFLLLVLQSDVAYHDGSTIRSCTIVS